MLELRDLGAHLDTQLRVEVRERLVHEEHLGLADDRPAHRDPLPLATGQLLRLAGEVRREIEEPRRPRDALIDDVLRRLPQPQAEGDVVRDGEVRVQRVVLEHHRDVPVLRRELVHDPVADRDRAVRDALEPGDHAKRGRLAATRRPDEDEELAVRDVDREVLDRVDATFVHLVDLFELHLSHFRPPPSSHEPPGMERRPTGWEHGVFAIDGNVLACERLELACAESAER